MSHVLVVFQADTERTEQFALAVGVGAVEAEASIRLRRLRKQGIAEVGHKGYGTLKGTDLLWADAVVVGLEDKKPRTEELEELLGVLAGLGVDQMKGRAAWTFGAEGISLDKSEAQTAVEEAFVTASLTVLPAVAPDSHEMMEQMKQIGHRLGNR